MKNAIDLTAEFNDAPQNAQLDEARTVTKERQEALKAQLSEPRLVLEFTPQGSVANDIRTDHDSRVAAEIAYIRSRLDKRRELKDRFNTAHDGHRGEHLPPRMKM